MTTTMILLVLALLAGYVAWRSHRSNPGSWMFGSVPFEDRDAERIRHDVLAAH